MVWSLRRANASLQLESVFCVSEADGKTQREFIHIFHGIVSHLQMSLDVCFNSEITHLSVEALAILRRKEKNLMWEKNVTDSSCIFFSLWKNRDSGLFSNHICIFEFMQLINPDPKAMCGCLSLQYMQHDYVNYLNYPAIFCSAYTTFQGSLAKSHQRCLYPNTLQSRRDAAKRCHTVVKTLSEFILLKSLTLISAANAINSFDMMLYARSLHTIGFDFELAVYDEAAKWFVGLGLSSFPYCLWC